MRSMLLALVLVLGLAATPAAAEMVRAQDPQTLVRALQAADYSATMGTNQVGDPMITSAGDGVTFQIHFYNCKNHINCATINFHAGYDVAQGPSLEAINAWNRGNRFGRAYLDRENDPILEMDVDLDDGGLSALLFIDNVEFWTSVLGAFENYIGFRR